MSSFHKIPRLLCRAITALLIAASFLLFGADAAVADTAYFTYNSAESGNFVYALNDAVTGTFRTWSVLGVVPGGTGYFNSPYATFYSKPFPSGNSVVTGDWTMNAWGRTQNASKVLFSPEIGEYKTDGSYTVIVPHGDLPAGFGWTPDFRGSNYTLESVTKTSVPAFSLSPGSRLYVRVWYINTHNTQNRDVYLAYDSTTENSNITTAAFAIPIPTLGWWLLLMIIIGFTFIAVRRGAVKLNWIRS
jgi:hypothetical protein